ncbi:MAG: hypothetical protein KDA58_06990, partial [Planctomycetaceae bacterium]|nr:hypothetical protein [Planctomycetaceae bacterium]
ILREKYPHIQRIILSGFTDSDAIIDAVNRGQVFQFVQKPWDRARLHSVLVRALEAHDLVVQNTVLTERLQMAERTASLGQLAAEIAHEMGNQLMLLPLVEVIEDEYAEDPQLMELAEMARGTHERLSRLIEEIKSFVRRGTQAKPDAQGPAMQTKVDLGQCVRELLSFLRFHRTIPIDRVSFTGLEHAALIAGDPFKLQQVLVNLLANAADAIADRPDGQVQVRIEPLPDRVVLSVSDNGTGIAPEHLESIWVPFFTTKGCRGTGLGLDVVKSIIEQHCGKVDCVSDLGVGTTFTIELPAVSGKAAVSGGGAMSGGEAVNRWAASR